MMPPSRLGPPDPLAPLARAAQSGDPASIRVFLAALAPRVLRIVRQVLGAEHPDVEDVTQEALVGILEAMARFRGESSVTHFIRRVALLTALNARRRHQLREHLAPRTAWEDAPPAVASCSTPAEAVETQRCLRAFEALLDELPAPQAEAIALHCVLGYTVGETAEACQVPENTVRSRLAAAKATLRKRLHGEALLEARIRGVS